MNLKLEALMHGLNIANTRFYGAEEEDQKTLLQETRDLRNRAVSSVDAPAENVQLL